MSDTNEDQEQEPTDVENVPAEEVAAEEVAAEEVVAENVAAEVAVANETPPKRRGNGVAWLALLVALVALAGAGYTISRDWLAASDTREDDAFASINVRIDAAQKARDGLAARVAELAASDEASSEEVDALRQELDERVRTLSSLPARMSTLESSVASLAGISSGTRDTWLLAEAEYYLQIANAQLQLANNPHLAALALGMADERVVQLGNPALIDVRRAISDELAALEVMEKPDIAGATLTLASLARVVESLPVGSSAKSIEQNQEAPAEEASGVGRAWSSMKNAMSGLVKVTPPDQAKLALLSPDAEYFLRNSLVLQLQSARLALLRGEQVVFEQALDDASDLLSQYFDSESAQVASAQETLGEIRNNVFTTSAPDISGSLGKLRQFRTLRENSQ